MSNEDENDIIHAEIGALFAARTAMQREVRALRIGIESIETILANINTPAVREQIINKRKAETEALLKKPAA